MHILLLTQGSAGDFLPFAWLGRKLRARGHRVTLITGALFAPMVAELGLEFIPIGEAESLERLSHDPRLWHPVSGLKFFIQFATSHTGEFARAVERCEEPALMIAQFHVFGARLAREKLGIPLITLHLYPMAYMSVHETPVFDLRLAGFRRLPLWLKRLALSLPNPVDIFGGAALRRLCAEHAVQPPSSFWRDWHDSPDGVLLAFPEWFAAAQPDWGQNRLQWTFPLEDMAAEMPLTPEITAFLDAGPPPVVFNPGSANVQAREFFQVAVESARRAGCRAIFVTRDAGQVPVGLTPDILVIQYAPFSRLFPRCAAVVHHGGIGTTGMCFAAGVPQLIVAMAFDQPDNADRVNRLGTGLGLHLRDFKTHHATAALKRLLHEPSFREASARCQRLMADAEPEEKVIEWIEQRARA